MKETRIEFNEPFYGEEEAKNLREYIVEGRDFTKDVRKMLGEVTKSKKIFLTGSASSAMEIFLASGLLEAGSEVIIPSFTYPAAANVVLSAGLKPVFADISPDTLVIDMDDIRKKITKKTSCIMPVHYGGASVDMDVLLELAGDENLLVVEDAALSIDAYYKGGHLGTLGDAGVISFHRTKNISGEGGGALIIRDSGNSHIFEEMLESGTDRKAFLRGETKAYSWQRPGRGMNMGPLSAAVLAAQLGKLPAISRGRRRIWEQYRDELSELAREGTVGLPVVPDFNENNHHVFYVVFNDSMTREKVRTHLLEKGINAVIHYMPLHSSPYGRKLGYMPADCPVSEEIAGRMLRLPMHMNLSEEDIALTCRLVRRALGR
ncbi:MAG TPA: aminotransferase class I/II-fold pyridoxal phosphate-dependent enzyme [Clostridia bacterium]|nr:aminotransferase class I/II-fold pyridoxal phosphate-dependent enzyme [Clostridia bacterium]HRX41798.1 aminotransferase class I/II-fold pyridoxal phosphate-dependent enzyme [Clostridia bacterium]